MKDTTNNSSIHNKRMWNRITAFFSRRTDNLFWYPFYLLLLLFLINITIMTIHRMDPDYDLPVLKHSFITAIYPNQSVNDVMHTDIVRITEFDETTIQAGDQVLIYNDFNIQENWVENVIDVKAETRQLELTYDGLTTINVRYENIIGVYDGNANLFGTIYYTAKFPTGYWLLLISHLLVLGAYYFAFLYKREEQS